jgi:hypothetical protein
VTHAAGLGFDSHKITKNYKNNKFKEKKPSRVSWYATSAHLAYGGVSVTKSRRKELDFGTETPHTLSHRTIFDDF